MYIPNEHIIIPMMQICPKLIYNGLTTQLQRIDFITINKLTKQEIEHISNFFDGKLLKMRVEFFDIDMFTIMISDYKYLIKITNNSLMPSSFIKHIKYTLKDSNDVFEIKIIDK